VLLAARHQACFMSVSGVTTRFVQNCTLSRPGQERGGNVA